MHRCGPAPDTLSAIYCRTASWASWSDGQAYSVTTLALITQSTLTPPFPCTENGSTCQNFAFSNSAGQTNALLYGFSVGGGLDWALTQNIFLRGEFEFVQFAPISNISVAIISGRAGAGFKF